MTLHLFYWPIAKFKYYNLQVWACVFGAKEHFTRYTRMRDERGGVNERRRRGLAAKVYTIETAKLQADPRRQLDLGEEDV